MTTPHSPADTARPAHGDAPEAEFTAVRADLVLGGRATLSAETVRGWIVAGQVASVASPDKLPRDLFPEFPDADPALIQAVWDRALVVGMHAERLSARPRFHRDQLARLQGELMAAGHAAMAASMGAALSTAVPVHPADGEFDGRGHDEL